MKQNLKELNGEIDKSLIITRGFSNSLSVIDRKTRKKYRKDGKDVEYLNNTVN